MTKNEEKLIYHIVKTRQLLQKILIASDRPVKNTSKNDCYLVLSKLQEKYKTHTNISDEIFISNLLGDNND